MAANVMEIYGSKVFNEHVMKERLPSATYKSLKNTLHKGAPLDIEVANVVAKHPEVQFNLSHTRGAVLVGIHDRPIGVDIERIRPVSERTMQRLAGAVTEREFFESWTRRESRAKWGGAGLAAMKREASPTMLGERFEYIETFPGYVACVCTHTDDALAPVRRFTLGDIT